MEPTSGTPRFSCTKRSGPRRLRLIARPLAALVNRELRSFLPFPVSESIPFT